VTRQAPPNVASTLARLRNLADAGGLSFNDVLQRYVIERFLARISRLPDADTVLLKGALMLRVWGLSRARPTMDIDLLRRGAADQATLRELVARCAAIDSADDVVEFDASTIVAEAITEEAEYVGTRIRLTARMGNVRQRVQIDFGVGDAVVPDPVKIEFPLLLGGEPIRLTAYPVEAAIAEKFHAMVVRDLRNSRMKDFYDIWMLSRNCSFSFGPLRKAIESTFSRRGTLIPKATPPALTEVFHGDPTHSAQWAAFVRRIGEPELVSTFATISAEIAGFLEPIISVHEKQDFQYWNAGGPWSPSRRPGNAEPAV
jgi:predicted nucleotidyltransferase component of viral defense system